MADGPTEPDPDDGGRPEDGRILSPEELDIEESEHVERLDEGRFVVSPDATADGPHVPEPDPSGEPDPPDREPTADDRNREAPATDRRGSASTREPDRPAREELTRETVHEWLRESFEDSGSRYGFDVTAAFDGSVSQRRMASNDVVTIFESLVLWYAQQVDSDTPVEEVLGILLMEANAPIRYPPESLKAVVKSAGLGPDDTIEDLLEAVERQDGLKL